MMYMFRLFDSREFVILFAFHTNKCEEFCRIKVQNLDACSVGLV